MSESAKRWFSFFCRAANKTRISSLQIVKVRTCPHQSERAHCVDFATLGSSHVDEASDEDWYCSGEKIELVSLWWHARISAVIGTHNDSELLLH